MKINYITKQNYQELLKIYHTTKQFTDEQRDCFIAEENNNGKMCDEYGC